MAVARWPLVFHSTFELRVCLSGPHLSLLYFSSTPVTLPHTSLPLPPIAIAYPGPLKTPEPRHFPPSAAIVISLPSTGPLIWLGWHVPRLYLTLAQINSWNQFMEPPPPPSNVPPPPCLSLSLFLLHLCTSSSSSVSPLVVCLFSNWSHISSLVCRNESLPCFPPLSSLSYFYLSLSLSGSPFPSPPYIHPPPTPTCSHRCVAPIYGFITAAIQGRRRGEKWKKRGMERDNTWEMKARERKGTRMIKIY